MAVRSRRTWIAVCFVGTAFVNIGGAAGQEPAASRFVIPPQSVFSQAAAPQPNTPPDAAPLTLPAAIAQARLNSQQLRSALFAAQLAVEDRVQARAALLPGVNGFLQHIYTEANGTPSGVFISNDGPRVYNAWANAHGDCYRRNCGPSSGSPRPPRPSPGRRPTSPCEASSRQSCRTTTGSSPPSTKRRALSRAWPRHDSFSTSRSGRSRAAKRRAPMSSKRRSRSSSGSARRRKPS